VSCAKPAEPMEMPFGLWAGMGPRNHVFDGRPEVLRQGRNHWRVRESEPPKFGGTTPTFLMKSVITVT